jgi:hypothetical protein
MNEKSIRQLIRESLNLLSESQASFLDNKISDVQEYIIDVSEKKLEALSKEEEKARDNEDFTELKSVKEKQLRATQKLVKGYEKKLDYLRQIMDDLEGQTEEIGEKGNRVFLSKELKTFENEKFLKGNKLKIDTISSSMTVMKIADYNSYRVLDTSMQGLKVGDLLKIADMSTGGEGKIVVFRNTGEKVEKVGATKLGTIMKLTKNPE